MKNTKEGEENGTHGRLKPYLLGRVSISSMEQWNRPPKALSLSPPRKNVVLGCPPTLLGVLGLGILVFGSKV